jgi:glutamine cyclotransferase
MRPAGAPARRFAGSALCGLVLLGWPLGCGGDTPARSAAEDCPSAPPEQLEIEVIEELPHDPTAFTQGLVLDDEGALFESTGLEGSSTVRQVDLATGEVVQLAPLDADLFGEGLALDPDGRLVQLTWTDGRALRWDRATLEPDGDHTYDGEGWGLALVSPDTFAMSDGSDTITLRDTDDFTVRDRVPIGRLDASGQVDSVDRLNELEWDGEHLWANRWQTEEILRIDLECARVDGVVDAAELQRRAAQAAEATGQADLDVLNGIAAAGDGELLLTGKRWPLLFRVRVLEAP